MKIKAFPEQVQLNPRNYEDFRFVRDFVTPQSKLEVQTDKLFLVNEDYKRLYRWIYQEQGRLESPEANVIDDLGNVYPHFLDLSSLVISNNEMQLDLVARKGFQHFYEKANGLTFEALHILGGLNASLKIDIDYLIVPDDLNLQRLTSLSLQISISYQLSQAILEASKLVGDATNPFTVTNAVIKAIAITLQIVFLVINLTINTILLKELYFPRIRKLNAYSDYALIKQAVEYLGFTLDSTVLFNLRFIATLPAPQIKPNNSIFSKYFNQLSDYFNTHYPTLTDSCPTLWSLIESYLITYNLRCFVYDGIVKIERRDYFVQNANMVIKPTFTDQGKRESVREFNDEEVYLRKFFHYVTDLTDLHAINSIPNQVRYSEVQTVPNSVINQDLVNIKGLNEYLIPFELAAVKTELTGIESAVSLLFGVIDSVLNFFGSNSNLQNVITDRLGVMMISQQFFQQTKRLYMAQNSTKQRSDYQTQLSISNIIDNYHADLKVANNCKRIERQTIPFTMQNFKDLEQNNFVTLESGEVVEVANCIYYDRKYKADVVLYFDDTSAFNVSETKIV
ncbi:MAG: hypothetical protein FGM14_14055 [Flavobacteriales bacterium]|nr:hypothetical protein [Flavobacteriales bacterium]